MVFDCLGQKGQDVSISKFILCLQSLTAIALCQLLQTNATSFCAHWGFQVLWPSTPMFPGKKPLHLVLLKITGLSRLLSHPLASLWSIAIMTHFLASHISLNQNLIAL
jgi:hypothetical protein